ncbi:hypothetical protein GQ607_012279, partial [Colletotrichum asianum]
MVSTSKTPREHHSNQKRRHGTVRKYLSTSRITFPGETGIKETQGEKVRIFQKSQFVVRDWPATELSLSCGQHDVSGSSTTPHSDDRNDASLNSLYSPQAARQPAEPSIQDKGNHTSILRNQGRIRRKYNLNSLGRVMCPYVDCEWTFFSSEGVNTHVKKAHEGKTSARAQRRNLFKKNDVGRHCCPHCSITSTMGTNLQKHIRLKHPQRGKSDLQLMFKQDSEGGYCCPHCGQSSPIVTDALHHLRFCIVAHPVARGRAAAVREWVCSVPWCINAITQHVFNKTYILTHAKRHEEHGDGKAVDCYRKVPPYSVDNALGAFWFGVFEQMLNSCQPQKIPASSSLLYSTSTDRHKLGNLVNSSDDDIIPGFPAKPAGLLVDQQVSPIEAADRTCCESDRVVTGNNRRTGDSPLDKMTDALDVAQSVDITSCLALGTANTIIWEHMEAGAATFDRLDTHFIRDWNLETIRLR